MALIYSQKWTTNIPNTETAQLIENEWTQGVAWLTPAQIDHGVDRMRAEFEWPPSIAEFINLSLDIPSLNEFLVGDEGLDSVAAVCANASTWDIRAMSIHEVRQWRRDVYPLLVKELRTRKMQKA